MQHQLTNWYRLRKFGQILFQVYLLDIFLWGTRLPVQFPRDPRIMQHWWSLRFLNFGQGLLQLTCFYIVLREECRSYRLIEVVYEFVKSRENLLTDHPRGVFVSEMCLSTGCWRQSRIMQQRTIGRCSLRNRRLGQIMCHDHCFMLVVHGSSAPAWFFSLCIDRPR